jgi:hypothetical protein
MIETGSRASLPLEAPMYLVGVETKELECDWPLQCGVNS